MATNTGMTGGWGGLLVALPLLLALFVANIMLGSEWITPAEVLQALTGGEVDQGIRHIVLHYRLPRALTGGLAGAALAVSGLQMQTLFRNPLAGPFVLGITSGASLGVALVVLGGGLIATLGLPALGAWLGGTGVVTGAMLGASAVMLLVLIVARRVGSPMTLLIFGLLAGYAAGAAVSVLAHFSFAERLQRFVVWGFGDFGGVYWPQLRVMLPLVALGLAAALALAKAMDALLLGEAAAASLGQAVRRVRLVIVIGSALLAATVVAYCGPIGFIGVAVPHLCRGLTGSARHAVLTPSCMVIGASVALLADLVAKLPGMRESLPLNAVTALIGAPIVAWVVLRQLHLREGFGS